MIDTKPSLCIARGSHVTLHYRIAAVVNGAEREIVNTFGVRPATVTIGGGDVSEALESCLIGLAEGSQRSFELEPESAFGERRSDLVQTLSRAVFDENTEPSVEYFPGDIVQFSSPEGRQFSGVLKLNEPERVVVDFNHPLAGLPLRFAVQVVGIL